MKDETIDYEKRQKERDKSDALAQLSMWKAAKILIENNELGAELHIAGLKLGICFNHQLLSVVEQNIREIRLFLKGRPNLYE